MKIDRVKTIKSLELIEIEGGRRHVLPPNTVRFLERTTGRFPAPYYVLAGTRVGAVERHWTDAENAGIVELVRIAEDGDPTLDGITLPIRSATQLSPGQMKRLLCGYLIGGRFHCPKCALTRSLVSPQAIPVYPVNIVPYSQSCSKCGMVVFDLWRSKKGGPLNIFQ